MAQAAPITRLPENPLITPEHVTASRSDLDVAGAFNAGVARGGDNLVLVLRIAERPKEQAQGWVAAPSWNKNSGDLDVLRIREVDLDAPATDPRLFRYRGVTYLTTVSHLRCARSTDGVHFEIDLQPALRPELPSESFGIEDPRVTWLEPFWWITYTAVSPLGLTTALARTEDLRDFVPLGNILYPEATNAVLFPGKIDDHHLSLTRPASGGFNRSATWLASSKDLFVWRAFKPVFMPRPGRWDGVRVGAGCVPFRVEEGWLLIYHGVDETNRYSMGAMLLDADSPSKVLARSEEPLLEPNEDYELQGFYGGVVFPCGADVHGDNVTIYYGAADRTTCGAVTTVKALLEHLGR